MFIISYLKTYRGYFNDFTWYKCRGRCILFSTVKEESATLNFQEKKEMPPKMKMLAVQKTRTPRENNSYQESACFANCLYLISISHTKRLYMLSLLYKFLWTERGTKLKELIRYMIALKKSCLCLSQVAHQCRSLIIPVSVVWSD